MILTDIPLREGLSLSLHIASQQDAFSIRLSGQVVFCRPLEGGEPPSRAIGIQFVPQREFDRRLVSGAIDLIRKECGEQNGSAINLFILEDPRSDEKSPFPISTLPLIDQTGRSIEGIRMAQPITPGRKRRPGRGFTPDPDWVIEMSGSLEPYRQAILQSRLVQQTSTGKLSLRQIRGWNIQFYPFIESFPHFMGLNLARANDRMSRTYLIDNIRVEKRHADQWIDMAYGFGVTPEEFFHSPILAEVEALTHWMWSVNSRGSLSEAVAATNYAIEGVTQGIATIMVRGFGKYEGIEGVQLDRKAYQWMEAHISYDDLHPFQALEIIKQQATSPEAQKKVGQAARRSLEYLYLALEACYTAFA
jgi:pyrroloquinoline quinone (PQQ) biosynthesis protein C